MSTQTRTALVIGGGIAGPVTAMALRQAGIEAAVYEAYPHSADNAGAGLSLAPNGLDALDAIGLGELVRPLGRPMTGIVLQDWAGRRLGEFGNPPGVPPMQFFWRADLYRALYQEAERRGIRIEHGKRLVGAEESELGVTAHFADGTRATADVLIGADGIRSTVRTLIDRAAPGPEYAGLISFGARVDRAELPDTGGKMNMSFGKRAFFGYQVFDDASAVWFVNLPNREPMTAAEVQRTPAEQWLPRLRQAFAEDRTPAARLIAATTPDQLLIVGPVENMPQVPTWSRGRLVLVGDSAHAPSSSSGQGASLAIESAIQLARCLRDLPREEGFAAYEAERRPRVEKIIKETTRKNSAKAAGPVGRVLNAWALRVFSRLVKPEKMTWMFDYRIDWEARVAGAPSRSGTGSLNPALS
ncbi:FAD-dependent urate hydroxylase [Kitasatospora sp. GAS204A]|uniref:FAD-dependent oxidoreductase n=1 Tax=unclassified Kitasatospora TaxID=2633591 RepID=UPI002473A0A0|nr:NAD(P)/FAD-dependent oxidoreductase [Kitasatospora sp. GAS204B]MDH6119557.1 FAD-dependent urate hydroxylase [Kitasatospora sp. GAS204B]